MSSPEFQVAFGVKGHKVVKELKKVGVAIDQEEFNLVDEGVFCGMYSGDGDCPEWLGLELNMLDNYNPFIDIYELNYEFDDTSRTAHKRLYKEKVDNLLNWLEENGYDGYEDLDLPDPEYFIACGTD